MSTGLRKKHLLAASKSGASVGITLVSSIAVPGAPNGMTSSSINTTGANLLVVCTSFYVSATLSDSKGNTWTGLTSYASSGGSARIFYATSPIVGTGHTFTVAGTSNYASIIVYAFSGVAVSSFQVETGIVGISPLNTGSVTPATNGSLIVTMAEKDAFTTVSVNLGFIQTTILGTNSVNMGCAAAYLIQPTAASINPQWTWTSAANAALSIVVFKK